MCEIARSRNNRRTELRGKIRKPGSGICRPKSNDRTLFRSSAVEIFRSRPEWLIIPSENALSPSRYNSFLVNVPMFSPRRPPPICSVFSFRLLRLQNRLRAPNSKRNAEKIRVGPSAAVFAIRAPVTNVRRERFGTQRGTATTARFTLCVYVYVRVCTGNNFCERFKGKT